MTGRIRVIRISRRPGFAYTHGGWDAVGVAEIGARLADLRGPRRPQVVEEPPRGAHPALGARVLLAHADAATVPRREGPPPFAVGLRDVAVVAVVLCLLALWRSL